MTNVLSIADVHNCTDCVLDSILGYQVTWEEDNNLQGYASVSGLTSMTTWDGVYFAVSNASSCYLGPSSDIVIDASVYTKIKFRFRVDLGHHLEAPTTARIQFKTSGGLYEEFISNCKF